MNALVEKLVKEINIDEKTAEKVLEIVKGFLNERLPAPLDKKVNKVLDGVDAEDVGDLMGKAKKLFGK